MVTFDWLSKNQAALSSFSSLAFILSAFLGICLFFSRKFELYKKFQRDLKFKIREFNLEYLIGHDDFQKVLISYLDSSKQINDPISFRRIVVDSKLQDTLWHQHLRKLKEINEIVEIQKICDYYENVAFILGYVILGAIFIFS